MTHRQTIELRDAKVQARLLRFLDRTSAWLFWEQFERATTWLESQYGFDPRLVQALTNHQAFKNWWEGAWRLRDEDTSRRLQVLVNDGPPVLAYTTKALSEAGRGATVFFHDSAEFRPFYLALHDPTRLEPQLKLPLPVLEQVKRELKHSLNTLQTA